MQDRATGGDMSEMVEFGLTTDGAVHRLTHLKFRGDSAHHSVKFRGAQRPADLLPAPLVDLLEDVLADLPAGAHVTTRPELLLSIPGATLARLRMLSYELSDGSHKVMLRFRYFVGSPGHLLQKCEPWIDATLPHREKIAVQALSDVAAPLFDLAFHCAGASPAGMASVPVQSVTALVSRVEELSFHMSLLMHHVDAIEMQREARTRFPGGLPDIASATYAPARLIS